MRLGFGMICRLTDEILRHLIVLDPLYARIITGSFLTMAVVHLDHVTVRSYDSSFTRRHNGASISIFNNNNNNSEEAATA